MNPSDLPFSKGHALGNDYIVVDTADLPELPATELIRLLCDRHRGVGSDGVLYGGADGGGFRLRIFNPDGSEAEKSGNGLRIFGAYLHSQGLVREAPFTVRLPGESVEMQVLGPAAAGALQIRVAIGRASFRPEDMGFHGAVRLEVGGEAVRVQPVSLGNPHCVVWVDELDREDFLRIAPQLVTHPSFEEGTNVQFACVTGPQSLEALIFERGVGETLASGSSASAVAAAAVQSGRAEPGRLTVRMPGGALEVDVNSEHDLRLTGPAQIVFAGRLA